MFLTSSLSLLCSALCLCVQLRSGCLVQALVHQLLAQSLLSVTNTVIIFSFPFPFSFPFFFPSPFSEASLISGTRLLCEGQACRLHFPPLDQCERFAGAQSSSPTVARAMIQDLIVPLRHLNNKTMHFLRFPYFTWLFSSISVLFLSFSPSSRFSSARLDCRLSGCSFLF